jgi:outer membrane protein
MEMRKSCYVLLGLGLIALLVAAIPQTGSAQAVKLGMVNDEQIKIEFKDWQTAQETWEVDNKAWEDEAIAQQTELEEMITEYEKQKLILSDEKKREKEAAINAKRDALDLFTKDVYGPGGKAERKHAQLIGPLLEKITKAIELVAIEENYDVIFTLQSGLGYVKESMDVTDKVLKKLEEID